MRPGLYQLGGKQGLPGGGNGYQYVGRGNGPICRLSLDVDALACLLESLYQRITTRGVARYNIDLLKTKHATQGIDFVPGLVPGTNNCQSPCFQAGKCPRSNGIGGEVIWAWEIVEATKASQIGKKMTSTPRIIRAWVSQRPAPRFSTMPLD